MFYLSNKLHHLCHFCLRGVGLYIFRNIRFISCVGKTKIAPRSAKHWNKSLTACIKIAINCKISWPLQNKTMDFNTVVVFFSIIKT